ncbi:MAG: hypothetical protein R3A52_26935 [Polyangiales bacterium]
MADGTQTVSGVVPGTVPAGGPAWASEVDLGSLTPLGREGFYRLVCARAGLDPATRPFAMLRAGGRWTLCAREGVTDALATLHGVTVEITQGPRWIELAGASLVHAVARATRPDGRAESAHATVPWRSPSEAARRCEVRARRRAVLTVLGLAVLDASEIDAIPGELLWEEPPSRARTLGRYCAAVEGLNTPYGAAGVWLRLRDDVAALPAADRVEAWTALCERARALGAPEPVPQWLRARVTAEENAR